MIENPGPPPRAAYRDQLISTLPEEEGLPISGDYRETNEEQNNFRSHVFT